MGDAKEGLGWVRDGVLEGLPEVSRMREEGGPVGGKSVQVGLLVPRLGSHLGSWCFDFLDSGVVGFEGRAFDSVVLRVSMLYC